jgi:hypothetical protein
MHQQLVSGQYAFFMQLWGLAADAFRRPTCLRIDGLFWARHSNY